MSLGMEYTNLALRIVGAPRAVNVNGKHIDPAVMLSPALGEPLSVWMAQSISNKLHGTSIPGLQLVGDPKAVSGCRVVTSPVDVEASALGLGEASKLLLLSEAVDQILSPAKRIRGYDYGDLIMSFNALIDKKYLPGQEVLTSDMDLNNLVYEQLQKPLIKSQVPTPRFRS
ncbi:MAG: hypothetical protein CL840_03745 [Crocinitomicaceae bacterium]|nr:hypothetical protein [Crocinitomicaceae bacterium]|tara:strand:+ start:260411 stop:260923 length:513 start_codon:yes stop_codon:yes gene_type:complete